MEQLLQAVVVAALVATSAAFATWRLMPARTKLRLLDSIRPTTNHALGRWLLRLRKAAADELAHGCSACSHASDHAKKHAARH